MTRRQLIDQTRRLIAEGERLQSHPSLAALRTWIALSDALLATAWGTLDRYHLAWLMVGRPADAVRGRAMTGVEEEGYVRAVAAAKTAALRMSLKAVADDGMPFLGETPEPPATPRPGRGPGRTASDPVRGIASAPARGERRDAGEEQQPDHLEEPELG